MSHGTFLRVGRSFDGQPYDEALERAMFTGEPIQRDPPPAPLMPAADAMTQPHSPAPRGNPEPPLRTPPPPVPGPSPVFNPDEEATQEILAALSEPTNSISSIAETFNITLKALILWLARPEIQQQLAGFSAIAASVTRAAAFNHLPMVTNALALMVRSYAAAETYQLLKPGLAHSRLQELQRANARKSSTQLMRLSHVDPSNAPRPRAALPRPADAEQPEPAQPIRANRAAPRQDDAEVLAQAAAIADQILGPMPLVAADPHNAAIPDSPHESHDQHPPALHADIIDAPAHPLPAAEPDLESEPAPAPESVEPAHAAAPAHPPAPDSAAAQPAPATDPVARSTSPHESSQARTASASPRDGDTKPGRHAAGASLAPPPIRVRKPQHRTRPNIPAAPASTSRSPPSRAA